MYKRIRELREDRDINQIDIALMLNITQANYSYIETGRSQPNLDILKKLCLFYNVSADYLLELPNNLEYPKR